MVIMPIPLDGSWGAAQGNPPSGLGAQTLKKGSPAFGAHFRRGGLFGAIATGGAIGIRDSNARPRLSRPVLRDLPSGGFPG